MFILKGIAAAPFPEAGNRGLEEKRRVGAADAGCGERGGQESKVQEFKDSDAGWLKS